MFIIGKDYKDADGALQVMIGKENFSLINEESKQNLRPVIYFFYVLKIMCDD